MALEIAPVPHRSTRGEWRRLALGLVVLTPMVLLVLLPAVLGLDRTIVTDSSMDGALGRGSVVLAREVPALDLRVGDVIAVRPSGSRSQGTVDRRIVAIDHGVATVESDRGGKASRQRVTLSDQAYSRVWLGVPWIGYPFAVQDGWVVLLAAAFGALILALATSRRSAAKPVGTTRTKLSVG